ncbi:MAG: DUF4159 domain-containing protein [Candidatus Latescibacterota bacterium]|jgi:hypothetical protein
MIHPPRCRIWVFAVVAIGLHLVLFLAIRSREYEQVLEPVLSGKFVKRRPMQQKVLSRPMATLQPSRTLRRAMPAAQAFARATAAAATSAPTPSTPAIVHSTRPSLTAPRREFVTGYGVPASGKRRSPSVAVEVAAQSQVDLGLELLDVEALDTGKYRALVVQDPADPRNLRGFVRVGAVGIRTAEQAAWDNDKSDWYVGFLEKGCLEYNDWRQPINVKALDELAVTVTEHTQLTMTVDRNAYLDDPGWMDTPFVLLTAAAEFTPNATEVENLGRYLTSGGFAYVEVVGHMNERADFYGEESDLHSLRGLVEAALDSRGLRRAVDWDIRPLPPDHPLYHCYYDISSLPRTYWSVIQAVVSNSRAENLLHPERFAWTSRDPPYLEGIEVNGRLAGIYSQQDYRDLWARRVERTLREARKDWAEFYRQAIGNRTTGDMALRLGINVVVYALTQEGGLARQYVARQ